MKQADAMNTLTTTSLICIQNFYTEGVSVTLDVNAFTNENSVLYCKVSS